MYSCLLLTHIHIYTIRLIKNATAQTHNDYNYFDHAYKIISYARLASSVLTV